ncbi:MAG: zinc ABC transporter substrate-binding protein [Bacilli bacterium]|nr:zinc ABC transporter substrate-binding protein [Bacilli bacterium]
MKKIIIIICCLFLVGCDFFKENTNTKNEVYTTTYPNKYLINYLYGKHTNIYSIYPSGVDFKEYTLSEKKLNEYSKSSIFIFNSQDIDRNYAVEMININHNLKLIDVALNMKKTKSIEELWLNPYNYLMMAKNTKNSLNEYITDPYIKNEINEKYNNLEYELSKLDATYKETFKNAKYKTIVADKELFKYLEKYDINVIVLEENIKTVTIKETDTLGDLSTKYGVSISDILTYNNKKDETITAGEIIKIPVKTIDSSNIEKVKKLITDKEITYIYTNGEETNSTVNNLITEYNLEKININTMYSIEGGIENTNENYITVMNNNLDLYAKELNK